MLCFRLFAGLASVPGLVGPALAAPPAPETLAPSSQWNVNYADDSCRLARVFGVDDAMTFVIMDRFAPGQSFRLTLGGKRFRNISKGGLLSVRFGPDEAEQKLPYFTGDFGKNLPALIVRGDMRMDKRPERPRKADDGFQVDDRSRLDASRIAAINELVVRPPLGKHVQIALGPMRAPLAALDKCIDDLLTRWGIDVARHATLSRRAIPASSPSTWLNYDDYPAKALFRGAQGMVSFRLSVDETGKPTSCHIQQSSRPAEFDTAVCTAVMRRARFTPALDKDGKPLASYFRATANFLMR